MYMYIYIYIWFSISETFFHPMGFFMVWPHVCASFFHLKAHNQMQQGSGQLGILKNVKHNIGTYGIHIYIYTKSIYLGK